MTSPSKSDDSGLTVGHPRGVNRGVRIVPLVGACLACCVPMLLVLGVISVGAALAGAVGLSLLVVLVAVAVVLGPRFRRGR